MAETEESVKKSLPRRRGAPPARRVLPSNSSPLTQMTSSFSHLAEIGKEVGLDIWKMIDEDTLEKVPRANAGSFAMDKAYIVLFTSFDEEGARASSTGDGLCHNIHSWYGDIVKEDAKVETAAEGKIQELETHFRGRKVITHREVQNHESQLFLSYYRNVGLTYVPPIKLKSSAAASAATKGPKLYQLKGRRNVRVKQVMASGLSLNKGDVFILDCDATIYQFNGSGASRMEKGKGLDLTVRMRDERGAKARVIILEEDAVDENPEFWKALGGKTPISEAEAAGDDLEFENAVGAAFKLYRVCDSSGELQVIPVDVSGGLACNLLDPNDCFILDCETEIFVWVGKASTEQEKAGAMANAQDFLSSMGRPSWTPITKLGQGCESALFKSKFVKGTWGEFVEKYDQTVKGNIAKVQDEKVNIDELYHPEKYAIAKEERVNIIPHDEGGQLKIYYVQKHAKFELPAEEYGIFFSANAYLIAYSVSLNDGSKRHVVYFWQGRKATQDDKGASGLLAKELAGTLGKGVIQVRVVQNKEPDHFLSHFKGRFLVKKGKRDDPPTKQALFHIRGTDNINIRAIEVNQLTKNLNSNDTFVLFTESKGYVWHGKGANPEERAMASGIAIHVTKNVSFQDIEEGNEPEEFWTLLGGKGDYTSTPQLAKGNIGSRLFQCSNATGVFKVFEIQNFSQDDLDNDDVMLLDNYHSVFVWLGSGSNDLEKRMSMETAYDYLDKHPAGNRKDDPIYVIEASQEPHFFTAYFHAWDPAKQLDKEDPYLKKLKEVRNKVGANFFQLHASDLNLLKSLAGGSAIGTSSGKSSPVVASPAGTRSFGTTSTKTPVVGTSSVNATPVKTAATPAAPVAAAATPAESEEEASLRAAEMFDLVRLKKKPWPDGVESQHLERYVNNADFQTTFKMTRVAFSKLPGWKQLNLKKAVGLF